MTLPCRVFKQITNPLRYVRKPAVILFWLGSFSLLPAPVFAQGGNFKVGEVVFDVTGSLGASYSTNISSSGVRPVSDFWLTTGIRTNGTWELTRFNVLNFGLGIEYRKYLKHSELDSQSTFLTLTPDTQLAFEVYVGAFTFQIADSLTFSTDPTDSVFIDPDTNAPNYDILSYSRFTNTASITGLWQINPDHRARLVYARSDVWALESTFNTTERTEHSTTLSLDRTFSAKLTAGVFATWINNDYWEDFQNDSTSWIRGVSASWQVTEFTTASAKVGWRTTEFDLQGSNRDQTDFSGMDYSFDLAHSLNSIYSHRLTISHGINYGFISNYTETDTISYRFTFRGFNRADINGGLIWQQGADSGGLAPEEYERWTAQLGLGYALSPKLRWEINYEYSDKTANLANRGYDRHEISIFFRYDF